MTKEHIKWSGNKLGMICLCAIYFVNLSFKLNLTFIPPNTNVRKLIFLIDPVLLLIIILLNIWFTSYVIVVITVVVLVYYSLLPLGIWFNAVTLDVLIDINLLFFKFHLLLLYISMIKSNSCQVLSTYIFGTYYVFIVLCSFSAKLIHQPTD